MTSAQALLPAAFFGPVKRHPCVRQTRLPYMAAWLHSSLIPFWGVPDAEALGYWAGSQVFFTLR